MADRATGPRGPNVAKIEDEDEEYAWQPHQQEADEYSPKVERQRLRRPLGVGHGERRRNGRLLTRPAPRPAGNGRLLTRPAPRPAGTRPSELEEPPAHAVDKDVDNVNQRRADEHGHEGGPEEDGRADREFRGQTRQARHGVRSMRQPDIAEQRPARQKQRPRVHRARLQDHPLHGGRRVGAAGLGVAKQLVQLPSDASIEPR
mmetsp:Transcript_4631/g.7712  ORF Transcript_4631/g.7712 Transcript_4631/m.7712 type:complete len:203 (+) Transcript_4631:379-987(+)